MNSVNVSSLGKRLNKNNISLHLNNQKQPKVVQTSTLFSAKLVMDTRFSLTKQEKYSHLERVFKVRQEME